MKMTLKSEDYEQKIQKYKKLKVQAQKKEMKDMQSWRKHELVAIGVLFEKCFEDWTQIDIRALAAWIDEHKGEISTSCSHEGDVDPLEAYESLRLYEAHELDSETRYSIYRADPAPRAYGLVLNSPKKSEEVDEHESVEDTDADDVDDDVENVNDDVVEDEKELEENGDEEEGVL